jgi:hypothetical protein
VVDLIFLQDWSARPNALLKNTSLPIHHVTGGCLYEVFKRDRKGNLLDAQGNIVADDPEKFNKAVHLNDIHLERGMLRRLSLPPGRTATGFVQQPRARN